MNPFNYIKDKVYGIDDLDISDDKKIEKIIILFSTVCAAVAIQPIPFADIFILTPIQAFMGTRIAKIRGYSFSMNEIYKEIIGLLGLSFLAQQTAIGLYKTILPFLGAVTTIPLVFILTYSMGKVMNYYFVSKTKGETLSKEDLIKAFKEARKSAKKNFNKDEIKRQAKDIKDEMKNYKETSKEFVQKNIDEMAVIAVMHKIKNGDALLTEEENIILEAMIRSTDKITDMDSAALYVEEMISRGSNSLMGASSNIKGIAHDLKYAKIENEDGDNILAFVPEDTSHPQYDVLEYNIETGEQQWVQLKSVSNPQTIYEWIEKYPGSEEALRVSEEVAREHGWKSSGISNEQMSKGVDDFFEKLEKYEGDLIDQLVVTAPPLTVLSSSFAVYTLFKKYKAKKIDKKRFIYLSTKITGLKAAKITSILALLSLPVIGQITAVYLISKLMLAALGVFEVSKEKLLLPSPSTKST